MKCILFLILDQTNLSLRAQRSNLSREVGFSRKIASFLAMTQNKNPLTFSHQGIFLFNGFDVHEFAHAESAVEIRHFLLGEFHDAVNGCVKSVVFSFFHVLSNVDFGSALTNKDLASFGYLSVGDFHSESLSSGIATQRGRTGGFLMCHKND